MATAGPGDRIREGEGADAAVQGSHLAAGAWSDRERTVMTGNSREKRGGLGSHAGKGSVSKEGTYRRFSRQEKRQNTTDLFHIRVCW